jgi:ATP-dependent protease HslVU (ClpYQ) ATPase subunit
MADFSPREIVSELDRYIVGQSEAKRVFGSKAKCAKKCCRKTF